MCWAILTCQWDLWKSNGLIFFLINFFTFFCEAAISGITVFKINKLGVGCFFYTSNIACGVDVLL